MSRYSVLHSQTGNANTREEEKESGCKGVEGMGSSLDLVAIATEVDIVDIYDVQVPRTRLRRPSAPDTDHGPFNVSVVDLPCPPQSMF
jgi:hypothetical protein